MHAPRAQAKYALPRGGGPAPRTTRIFVARIPLSVGDAQFRQYFEQFGHVQVGLPGPSLCTYSYPEGHMRVQPLQPRCL